MKTKKEDRRQKTEVGSPRVFGTKSQFITTILCIMFLTPLLWRGAGGEVSAQNVGISATGINPDNSAMLDVTSNTKGMLIPRMTGTEKYTIPSPATGLLIFQTDTVGFWYYDGTKWIPLVSSTSSTASPTNAGWLTTGNIGTAWDKHFLGTIDNVSLRLRTNNTERMVVDSLGNIYFGKGTVSYPTTPLAPWACLVGKGVSNFRFAIQDGVARVNLYWNAYNDATMTQRYVIANEQASHYMMTGGSHIFRVAGTSAAAGDAITWKTGIYVDNSANVGIGAVAAPGACLDVNPTYTGATVANLYNLRTNFTLNNAAATITNYFGQYITAPTVTAGTLTNTYALVTEANAGNVGIGTTTPAALFHVAADKDATYDSSFVVTSTGKVGIGTTNPAYKLHTFGYIGSSNSAADAGNVAQMFVDAPNTGVLNYGGTAALTDRFDIRVENAPMMTFLQNGNVGINCTNPQYKLHVVGNVGVVGTIYATVASVTSGVSACSDIRYKKDITPLSHALDKVLSMQGVNYHWKTDAELRRDSITTPLSFGEGQGVRQLGFIAQDLEKVIPEVVMTDKDGYKSVDYSRLTPVLVEAIKEQQKMISNQQKIINNSVLEIAELKAAVNKLTQQSTTEEAKK